MRIQARKCSVLFVEADAARNFIETNHRQGALKSKGSEGVSVGLIYEDELVAVAQFGSPRTKAMATKYSVELLRMAFQKDTRIPGGASKMISFFRNQRNPADLFTYQDASGEVTDVYSHAGMVLVSQSSKKDYLVAPGRTIKTGTRKEVLGIPYAVRYGPDRILGTKLGEVYREDGTRKSNVDIFVEELGWHLETTAGDKVFEWINPERSYYVYRLSAEGSDRYYYGVRQLKFGNASVEDCLTDSYWGSGSSAHFKRWRSANSSSGSLRKEIVAIFSRRMQAYQLEAKLVGDFWKTDPNCLNSCAGGLAGGILNQAVGVFDYERKLCTDCGKEAQHQNGNCLSCRVNLGKYLTHCDSCNAETLHRAGVCYKCASGKSFSERFCGVCGETTIHRKNACCTCQNRAVVTQRWCDACSATTKHQGTTCNTCNARKSISLKTCVIHGETKHQGNVCNRCNAESSVNDQWCTTCEATTKHQSGKCYGCKNREVVQEKYCSTCDAVTKHAKDNCYRCRLKSKESFCATCSKITKHNGSECIPCRPKRTSMQYCDSCGEDTKFRGMNCLSCKTKASIYSCEICEKDTKHKRNGVCTLCERREGRRAAKALIEAEVV